MTENHLRNKVNVEKSWSGTKSGKEGFITNLIKKLKLRYFFIDLGYGLYYKVIGK
jgi:hypothetical protein